MEIKKYELTDETLSWKGHTLHRIKALRSFGNVDAGTLGGWIESENNLSHEGYCWVYQDAKVYDNAVVKENAKVYGHAEVYDNAGVKGDAQVYGHAEVYGFATVFDDAQVCYNAQVFENAKVGGWGWVCDSAKVYGHAVVYGHANVRSYVWVFGDAQVCDNALVFENAKVGGNAYVYGNAVLGGDAVIKETKDYAVFKNTWSSGRYFTWTRSNDKWKVGCFYGTGKQLIKKAYADGELKGKCYEAIVQMQNKISEVLN